MITSIVTIFYHFFIKFWSFFMVEVFLRKDWHISGIFRVTKMCQSWWQKKSMQQILKIKYAMNIFVLRLPFHMKDKNMSFCNRSYVGLPVPYRRWADMSLIDLPTENMTENEWWGLSKNPCDFQFECKLKTRQWKNSNY